MAQVGEISELRFLRPAILRYTPALLLLVVGTLATIATYRVTRRYEESAARLHFERTGAENLHVVEDLFDDQIHQLEAALALFQSSQKVESSEFTTFARSLLSRSDFDGIEWAPRVTAAQRAELEASVDGGFTEWRSDGTLVRAGPRDEYFPVYFLEPMEANARILGFDLGSEPSRSAALTQARDSGTLAVAGPLHPLQNPAATSYLLILAHYRAPAHTLQQRRELLEGFVAGLLRPQTVLNHATRYSSRNAIDWTFRDGPQIVAQRLAHPDETPDSAHVAEIQASVQLGPRTLLAEGGATAAFLGDRSSAMPLVVLIGGSTASVMLALYLVWLITVIMRQKETEQALTQAQRLYRSLVEQAPEAILVLDTETMRFVEANPAAEHLLKMSRDECLRVRPEDLSVPAEPGKRSQASIVREMANRALAGEAPSFNLIVRDSMGERIHCEVRLSHIPGGSGKLVRGSLVDVSERHRAEETQRELLRELDHRVKNCFATVLALAEQTAGATNTQREFHDAFSGRVRAMARAHEALAARDWKGASVPELISLVLGAYDTSSRGRVRASGPPMTLAPQAASAMSMLLHELGTNAAKYGALSVLEGHVELRWKIQPDGGVTFEWREYGGPTPDELRPGGFGTRLIRGLVEHELGGTLEIERHRDGLGYCIALPAEHVSSLRDQSRNAALPPASAVPEKREAAR